MTRAQGFGLFLIVAMSVVLGVASELPDRRSPTIFTDRKTGCEYLAATTSITPRLRADGSQVCAAPKE